MKIACVQMNIHFGEPEKNFPAVEKYIEIAAKSHADTIVFPEMWNTGYALSQLDSLADEDGQQTKQMLNTVSKRISCEYCRWLCCNEKSG